MDLQISQEAVATLPICYVYAGVCVQLADAPRLTMGLLPDKPIISQKYI